MPRTTQCTQCGVVLTVPDHAIGKRLKCPKCGSKFAVSPGAEGSPDSTFLPPGTAPPSSQEVISARSSSAEAMPTAAGDLRDTFDLPLMREEAGGSGMGVGTSTVTGKKQTADALALFNDQPKKEKRRLPPAEERSKPRRCPTCGGVVPAGMSICSKCGLDLESGSRVSLEDDFAPPPAPPEPTWPLPVAIIGGICFLASLIFTIATLSLWLRGGDGFQYFVPLCLFAVFASVQFLRRKSLKLLLIALTFGLAIDIVAMIAMPIFDANARTNAIQRTGPIDHPEQVDIAIPSVVDQLDTQKLSLGITLILVYTGVTIYLVSPPVRRYFR
jgi:Zn finger protein HypA/HybF involved in hydrogenase expression